LLISSYVLLSTLGISNTTHSRLLPHPTLSQVPVEEFYTVKDKKNIRETTKQATRKEREY
jgi:hypothetical protein